MYSLCSTITSNVFFRFADVIALNLHKQLLLLSTIIEMLCFVELNFHLTGAALLFHNQPKCQFNFQK